MNTPIKQTIDQARAAGLIRRNIDNMPTSARCESVYLRFANTGVPGLGTDLYFKPNDLLDGVHSRILAIECIDAATNPAIYGNSGTDVLSAALLAQGMFYAVDGERELIWSLPLPIMVKRLNAGKFALCDLNTQVWQNCFVRFTDVSSLGASNGLWFNVWYTPRNVNL